MSNTVQRSRTLPPLARSYVRGFVNGALVALLAGLSIIIVLAGLFLTTAQPAADWPTTLKAGDCRYSGSVVQAYRVSTDGSASDLAEAYARTWSTAGWDVSLLSSPAYAMLTATRPMMTYSLQLMQEGNLIQAVSAGQQCE